MTRKDKKFYSELRSYFNSIGIHPDMTADELFTALGFRPGDYLLSSQFILKGIRKKLTVLYGRVGDFSFTDFALRHGIQVLNVRDERYSKTMFFNYLAVDKEGILPWLKILRKHKRTLL